MKPKSHYRDIIGFLEHAGARDIRVEPPRGRGHPRLVFVHAGREYRVIVACSPSSPRSIRNVLAFVKRSIGLTGGERRIGERRTKHLPKRHLAVAAAPVSNPPRIRNEESPLNTPFVVLAALREGLHA